MYRKIVVTTYLFIVINCFSLHNSTNAQTPTPILKGSVNGIVTVKKSGKPVKRASVSIKSKELDFKDKTTTDNDGKYLFSDLSAGNYTLRVNKQGFKNAKKKIELAEGENEVVDVQLKKETKDDGGYGGGY